MNTYPDVIDKCEQRGRSSQPHVLPSAQHGKCRNGNDIDLVGALHCTLLIRRAVYGDLEQSLAGLFESRDGMIAS